MELDVKKIRAKLDVSQEKFAELIGVSTRTVQNWESGTTIPTSKHAILRNFLKVEDDEIELNKTNDDSNIVSMTREVFDQITRMTEALLSQQKTIESQQDSIKELLNLKNNIADDVLIAPARQKK